MNCVPLIKYLLTHGASIYPLNVDLPMEEDYVALCNPSVAIDNDGTTYVVVRNVNYMLWNTENDSRLNSNWGPLIYVNKGDDRKMKTQNYIGRMEDTGFVYSKIDTTMLDKPPLWEFVGLEDARLLFWNDKMYVTGVRRDVDDIGTGRMELCEIVDNKEVSRVRIQSPDGSYCEKNWMPVVDMPYHYVRWANPTQVVKVDPKTGSIDVVFTKDVDARFVYNDLQMRGSSQVVRVGDYRIAVVHSCGLWINSKQQKCTTRYVHQVVVWDLEWNIVRITEPFSFNDFGIEFMVGLAYKDGYFYIPFALQDNMAFLCVAKEDDFLNFVNGDRKYGSFVLDGVHPMLSFFNNPFDCNILRDMGEYYDRLGQYAGSCVCYLRAINFNTYSDLLYSNFIDCGRVMKKLPDASLHEHTLYSRAIECDNSLSDAYSYLGEFFLYERNEPYIGRMFLSLALQKDNFMDMNRRDLNELLMIESMYHTEDYWIAEDLLREFAKKQHEPDVVARANYFIDMIQEQKKLNEVRVL